MRQGDRQGWHREDIKAALRKKHGGLEALSMQWGYHRSAISVVLARGLIAGLEQRIANELGEPLHILWPDRWAPDGTRLPPAERDNTGGREIAHRPNQRAA
jgi:Ner family transcriptional regulator